jgi:hypothetical protein
VPVEPAFLHNAAEMHAVVEPATERDTEYFYTVSHEVMKRYNLGRLDDIDGEAAFRKAHRFGKHRHRESTSSTRNTRISLHTTFRYLHIL